MKVFGDNREKVGEILTMAYFPFVDNLSYSQMSRWQKEVKTPTDINMTPKAITMLTQSITEQNRMDMFRCRAARVGKDELCAVDSTSISTYGFNLVDIRWGRNKEHLPLRLEKARVFDPFGHAGFDPSGKIRLTPKKSWRRGSTLFYLI